MKKLQTKLNISLFLLSLVAFLGVLVLPFVGATTASAQYATPSCTSATLNGSIVTNGAPTQVWFQWGQGNSLSNTTSVQTFNTNSTFSQPISGLTQNTTYSYRAMAQNVNGDSTGQTLSFTTLTCNTPSAPTVNLTANPTSINFGGASTLSWNSTNATSCSAYWTGSTATNGSGVVTPGSTTTYSITCSNNVGSASDTATVTVASVQNLPTVNLTANPTSINFGGASTLSWNSTNATSCSAYWTGSTATNGSGVVTPGSTTTYSITCSNNVGSASDTATVTVGGNNQNLPTVNIEADDTRIDSDDRTIVRWSSSNADSCTARGGRNGWSGSKSISGSFNTGDLSNDVTYTITCRNSSGSADDSVTVRVDDEDNNDERPDVNIYANPSNVQYNGASTITWNSDNADSCRGTGGTNGWSGRKSTSGSFYTGNLAFATTFTIICENDSRSVTDSTRVTVNGIEQPVNNRPTVSITADQTNLNYNGATTIRWSSSNATSCFATGGSVGWAGAKSIGPASFYTGSLTGTRTYSINCSNDSGSSSDFVTVGVRGQVLGTTTTRVTPTASSYLLVTSSVDRNRPIVPTLDNTNPCPGDDINYSITYQNIGNASLRNLVLRVDLPREVDYITSTPLNPTQSGQTLIFNLGTLKANEQGTVKIQVSLRNDVAPGTDLNFPATLTYTDVNGSTQSVNANVNASVCQPVFTENNTDSNIQGSSLGAMVFGAGFLPTSIFGWLLLLILILILILLAKYLFGQSFQKRTVTTYDSLGKTTTTMTH